MQNVVFSMKEYGHVEKIDADVLARICYILDCNPGDIILYKVSDE